MPLSFKTVKHENLDSCQLHEISALKNQHWEHTLDSQRQWIEDHYQERDTHVLAYREGSLLAYAGLVYRKCILDDMHMDFIGLGNVCVDKNSMGNGYGAELVRYVNEIIHCEKMAGMLLCHDKLMPFYAKFGWHQMQSQYIEVENVAFKERVMAINIESSSSGTIRFFDNF